MWWKEDYGYRDYGRNKGQREEKTRLPSPINIERSAIPMKLIADMICRAGATRLVSLDLYRKEIQGFFSIPVDNLRASLFLSTYLRNRIPDYRNCDCCKNPDVMHKATSYADRVCRWRTTRILCVNVGPIRVFPRQNVKEKPPLTVVGDVGGRIAIIVDDIKDGAQSFVDAAEVVVTNSVPHDMQKLRCHKICTVDVSLIISEAIRRIYYGEGMGQLLRGVTINN